MSLMDPPYIGFFPAQVVDNDDPQGLYRVKYVVPALMGDVVMEWAKPIGTLFGGGVRRSDGTIEPCGFAGTPPVGAAIMVMYVGGDMSFPYYMGGWFAEDSEDATRNEVPVSPRQESPKGSPKVRLFETAKWRFFLDDDDTTPILRLEQKGNEDTAIEIDAATGTIAIRSKPSGGQECVITMDGSSGTITIDGDTEIKLGASALEKLVKGSTFLTFFNAHVHTETGGTTSAPTVPMVDLTHLSQKSKTE